MKSSFASRRQARKVGRDDDEQNEGQAETRSPGTIPYQLIVAQISDIHLGTSRLTASPETAQNVIRPSISSRGSSKAKKRSSLRMSFGPEGTSMTEEDDGEPTTAVFTPKKSNLGRQAIEKNALRKTIAANLSADHLPLRQTDERPSYSVESLNELKTSTPSTPKELTANPETGKFLDLASKFGSDLSVYDTPSAIPTDTEIREKKERRARLAKEQDFISLDDADSDHDNAARDPEDNSDSENERSLLPYAQEISSKRSETRLVRDDEDIAEGFDAFDSDGRIALSRKAEREQKTQQKAQIRDLINEAEGSSDESESDSEAETKAAYEAAQTHKGLEGLRRAEEGVVKPRRPEMPAKITPLPTLGGCLERLKEQMEGKRYHLVMKERRLEEVNKERADIRLRKEEVQRLLREKGEEYEKLRREAAGEEVGGQLGSNKAIENGEVAG